MTAEPVEADLLSPPTHVHVPARAGSLLRPVLAVGAKIGRRFDPAQQMAIDVLTSAKLDGRPASLESCVICPRQNLKTYCLEAIVLTRLLQPNGDRLVVWSAHEVQTAQETFRSFCALAERNRWLGSRVTSISRATGREAIQFAGGRWLRFRARIKTGGRGLAGDLIVLDEAFALRDEHMGSLVPILSTRPRAQILYGSSSPLADSEILRRVMQRGRDGGDGAPAYVEWRAPGSFREPGCTDPRCQHAPGTPGCVMDDETLWAAANPAHAYGRISVDYLRAERLALPPEEFGRERLGWWSESGYVESPIPMTEWLACGDAAAVLPERVKPAIVVDASPGLRSVAIAIGARNEAGTPHLELVDFRTGSEWAAERLAELHRRYRVPIWLHRTGPVAGLLPDLITQRVPYEMATNTDLAAACVGLQAAVRSGTVVHLSDPIVTEALGGAVRREIGDGSWLWGRRPSGVDIAPLIAMTLAFRAAAALPRRRTEAELMASFG